MEVLFAAWDLWQLKSQDMRKSINLISPKKLVLPGWATASLEAEGLQMGE